MNTNQFLAFDFGASSGRGIIGSLENNKIQLEEIHRFSNNMTFLHGSYYWDIFRLYDEIRAGLASCKQKGIVPESVAVDTWGVDYALLDEKGNFLGIPYAYRDHRTDTAMDELFQRIPPEKLYQLTGIQFMQFNTVFQLYATVRDKLPALNLAKDLLFMPDIFNYMLSGIKKTDFSFATTSQLYNPNTGAWEKQIFDTIGVSMDIMQDIVEPGTVLGELHPDLAKEYGLRGVDITAVASHDTGSAIAAIPSEDQNFAYISSGTWSLMGFESDHPVINDASARLNFTNEGGVGHTFRVLKNIMGLWLIQECKRIWDGQQKKYTFPELVKMSQQAPAFRSLVDPNDARFLNPQSMPNAIAEFCKETNQPVPEKPGEFARCIFESLAFAYRKTVEGMKEISDKQIDRIHIIGGGSQNELLCQFTANATGLPVVAGPAEGTALGNIMVQAMAKEFVSSLKEIRQLVRGSFTFKTFEPDDVQRWDDNYNRFLGLG
jgi:rhamnulokinase